MSKVICINDKNQPQGAEVVKDTEYTVLHNFMNAAGQKVFLIEGINNEGTTKMGFPWYGYAAERFAKITKEKMKNIEHDFALN
jgi:hypothetical protein